MIMPTISIEISDADAARISYRAKSADDWITNATLGCAALGQTEIEATAEWMQAMISFSQMGGDITDKDAVLLHGFQAGIIMPAEARYSHQSIDGS